MTEKVGIYCRLSDEDKDKINRNDDSDSIINQRSMCLKYAKQNNWNVVDIYSDDDFSGAGTYRPDFERLINDCESGKINLVLCKSQSRFSRDMEIIEKYLHNKFIVWKVRFVSIIDNADTSIESNKKSRQINGLINEWYLEDLSHNIKKSLKNKREDGLFVGSFAPYGYNRSKDDYHKLVIDPVASEVVKTIFYMYASGNSYNKICNYLNNNNILPRALYKRQNGSKLVIPFCDYKNLKWNPNTIVQILKNEVYIGNLVQGKVTSVSYKIHKYKKVEKQNWSKSKNTHEPIIDIKTWEKVQSILGTHTKPILSGEIHCLSKKVYCCTCGSLFGRNVYNSKDLKTRSYLQCTKAKKKHDCSNNHSIKIEVIEKIIKDSINKYIKKYYNEKILQDLYSIQKNKLSNDEEHNNLLNEKKALAKKITNIKYYLQSLYEDKIKGVISNNIFNIMSNNYLNEIENINSRIETINKNIERTNEQNKNIKIFDVIKKYESINKLNKLIVDEFIYKIYIDEFNISLNERTINIEWNF